MKKILLLCSLFFITCGCNGLIGGIPTKKQNEQFFDISFHAERNCETCYVTDSTISRLAGWIKVGQTYTFSKVNYIDNLESPPIKRQTYLTITFNDNRTVRIKGEGPGQTLKVLSFMAGELFLDPFDENSTFVRVDIFFENSITLHMFKKHINNKYAKNKYGLVFAPNNCEYWTGSVPDKHWILHSINVFNY